jgi:hypothetical protein
LDPAQITIGEQAQLGPYVQLLTADHPRDAATRAAGPESAQPINIGERVWLGGGMIVHPGVSIVTDKPWEPAASLYAICPPESLLRETDVACSGVCDFAVPTSS